MSIHLKTLRLVARAAFEFERIVCALSWRIGQYTLAKHAASMAREEDELYARWQEELDAESPGEEDAYNTYLLVEAQNDQDYRELSLSLGLEARQ